MKKLLILMFLTFTASAVTLECTDISNGYSLIVEFSERGEVILNDRKIAKASVSPAQVKFYETFAGNHFEYTISRTTGKMTVFVDGLLDARYTCHSINPKF
jgi:hypothetical protein